MDPQFIQWIVGQSGVAGVATLALWMLRQAYEDRDRTHREMIEREKEASDTMIQVLQEHTAAVAKNTAALEELQRIVEALRDLVNAPSAEARVR